MNFNWKFQTQSKKQNVNIERKQETWIGDVRNVRDETAGHGIEFKNKIAIINFTGPLYISPSKEMQLITVSLILKKKKKKKLQCL